MQVNNVTGIGNRWQPPPGLESHRPAPAASPLLRKDSSSSNALLPFEHLSLRKQRSRRRKPPGAKPRASTGACQTVSETEHTPLGVTISYLHFSPRREKKCVRGPSGRGASRAEENGARNTACKIFHESRNTAFTVHRPSDISSGANKTPAHGFHESRDTRHESRPFYRVLRPSGGQKCRVKPSCATVCLLATGPLPCGGRPP